MPTPTTTTTKGTKTTKQLWEVNCEPTCGFTVRDHSQQALVQECQAHMKVVHPEMKMTEKEIMGMAKMVR